MRSTGSKTAESNQSIKPTVPLSAILVYAKLQQWRQDKSGAKLGMNQYNWRGNSEPSRSRFKINERIASSADGAKVTHRP